MNAPANDLTDRAPVPSCHCATCRHWGVSTPTRRGAVQFGQCFVARGAVTLYMSANAACSVRTADRLMWQPVAVPA